MTTFAFTFESRLRAPAEAVWAHATSMEGINYELFPIARMTAPPGLKRLEDATIVPGQRVFRSWIFALGIVPIDYDDLTLVEIGPYRFLERSPMLSQRWWEHERVVAEAPFGCTLRDSVRYEPRAALLGRLQLPIFRMTFRNRHARLARRFGRA